mgnify:CR=1 FL=1
MPRWYYNKEENMCKRFAYTGIGGNLNNFESEALCTYVCIEGVSEVDLPTTTVTTPTTETTETATETAATDTTATTTETTAAADVRSFHKHQLFTGLTVFIIFSSI